jgi:hypothetical protein
MTTTNVYSTLTEFKGFITSPGQTMSTDTTDDAVMERILEASSRYIDAQTWRKFYPRIETRQFDIPYDNEVWLDDDLLAVITFSNGDGTAITDYVLKPYVGFPKWCIRLKDQSSVSWALDSDNNGQGAIDVAGWWGYHDNYTQHGWASGGTLSAAVTDTTTLAFSATTGHTISGGQIVKIDSEIYIVSTAGTNTITPIARGDNGSTAATHLISAPIYIWQVMPNIRQACLEIASNANHRRFGVNIGGTSIVTPSGYVIGPRDVSEYAAMTITNLTRRVL